MPLTQHNIIAFSYVTSKFSHNYWSFNKNSSGILVLLCWVIATQKFCGPVALYSAYNRRRIFHIAARMHSAADSSAHLSNASSNELPESIIRCWASLCRRPSVGVAPIRTMVSPTCRPHLAAKLPGVTYNREDISIQSRPPAVI